MGTSGPGDVETRWLFRPLPDQRVQHSLGALSLVLPLGGPPSWDSGFLQRGRGTPGAWKVLLICGTFSTTPGAPGHSRLETQTHSGFLEVTQHRTLRPEQNRVGISFLFPFLFTNLGFILECNWLLIYNVLFVFKCTARWHIFIYTESCSFMDSLPVQVIGQCCVDFLCSQ